jgi:exonuclease III
VRARGPLPSTKFLFWNINRKPLAEVVADLADEHKADVIVLAECNIDPATMLMALNRGPGSGFHFPTSPNKSIKILTRFSRDFVRPVYDSDRLSVRRLNLPSRSELLLAALHFPSKLFMSDDDQVLECTALARTISDQEKRVGHQRTVLVGDFNMNPFESGMVGAAALHSVMSRQISSRGSRTVQGQEYPFFYNPMWNHLGDARSHTAGTYFWDNSKHVNYFWNAFDQVLLRPELAERFDPNGLKILTSVGDRSLVRPDGRPDNTNSSDHLPLVFELEF